MNATDKLPPGVDRLSKPVTVSGLRETVRELAAGAPAPPSETV